MIFVQCFVVNATTGQPWPNATTDQPWPTRPKLTAVKVSWKNARVKNIWWKVTAHTAELCYRQKNLHKKITLRNSVGNLFGNATMVVSAWRVMLLSTATRHWCAAWMHTKTENLARADTLHSASRSEKRCCNLASGGWPVQCRTVTLWFSFRCVGHDFMLSLHVLFCFCANPLSTTWQMLFKPFKVIVD